MANPLSQLPVDGAVDSPLSVEWWQRQIALWPGETAPEHQTRARAARDGWVDDLRVERHLRQGHAIWPPRRTHPARSTGATTVVSDTGIVDDRTRLQNTRFGGQYVAPAHPSRPQTAGNRPVAASRRTFTHEWVTYAGTGTGGTSGWEITNRVMA